MGLLNDLVSGFFGNEAADKAADAQANAAKSASQTTLDMFNRGNQITAPNQQAGWNALAMQGSLLGNPNMVPQGAVANALAATGQPGAQSTWANYGAQNPDVVAYYRNNPAALAKFGGNMEKALEYHYNTFGQGEGRQLPAASYGGAQTGTAGGNTGIGVGTSVDDAYATFLDSGFGRSALETTNNDFQQMVGAFGAGGTSLSGSAVGALNAQNRRNTQGAFGDYYNALSGISGTGAQIGQNQATAANAAGTSIANNQKAIGDVRASSYLKQGENNAGMVNSGINAAAGWFGG